MVVILNGCLILGIPYLLIGFSIIRYMFSEPRGKSCEGDKYTYKYKWTIPKALRPLFILAWPAFGAYAFLKWLWWLFATTAAEMYWAVFSDEWEEIDE